MDIVRVVLERSLQFTGVNLLLKETPITRSDPVFIDQATMRAFSVSQSAAAQQSVHSQTHSEVNVFQQLLQNSNETNVFLSLSFFYFFLVAFNFFFFNLQTELPFHHSLLNFFFSCHTIKACLIEFHTHTYFK